MYREKFEAELNQLYEDIIDMGTYVNNAIKQSIQAYRDHDLSLCEDILKGDDVVNEMEKKIESKCLWLIAREQPVASDLRNIATVLKIVTDMERIGDHAADIAELAMYIPAKSSFADFGTITEMGDATVKLVNNALTAYVNSNLELAKRANEDDDKIDEYFNKIKKEIRLTFYEHEEDLDDALEILLIAKYLERIADHAVNICDWVFFSQTGEHRSLRIF